jgi:hypothetical protein
MSIALFQQLYACFLEYTLLFPYDGHIPLDTHQWHEILFPYPAGPNGMVETDRALREDGYRTILLNAEKTFPKYNFSMKFDTSEDETCRVQTPYKYWLKYELKPELQE